MSDTRSENNTTVLERTALRPKQGLLLRYRLFLRGGIFYVEVRATDAAGERCQTSGGMRTLSGARRFFRLITSHAVTPYTLDAVYDEWAEIL